MSWPINSGEEGLVVIFTKDNVERIKQLEEQYNNPPFSVVLLDDSTSEQSQWENQKFAENCGIHYHGSAEQKEVSYMESDLNSNRIISDLGETGWTLGNCRNYALLMADKTGWNRVLMIDDDIHFRSWDKPRRDFERLNDFPFIGSSIVNMPDSSVVGYLFRASGIIDEEFLSGAYLGIRLDSVVCPFPNIYNEDWIWVFQHQSKGSVPLFGTVIQTEYDWTTGAVEEAKFQEFGEIVIEAMLRAERCDISYRIDDSEFWDQALKWRKEKLRKLDSRTVPHEVADIKECVLDELYQFHIEINPEDIIRELGDWIDYDRPFP